MDMNPGKVKDLDWETELMKNEVNYSGQEVGVAEQLTCVQVAPALPPKGVAASLPALDVCEGAVREALLHPEDYRLPDDKIDSHWPTPRIHAEREE